MTSFVLPGKSVMPANADDLPDVLNGLLKVHETHETWLGTSRDGTAAQSRTEIGELADDDIVEIRLEGGLKLWQSVADTRADFASADRSITDQALLVPRNLRIGTQSTSRGEANFAVEGVKILKVAFNDKAKTDIVGKAGEFTAFNVAHYIESKLDLGFHRCIRQKHALGPRIGFAPASSRSIDTNKPMLVLVHGTFSSTQGSFGDLVDNNASKIDVWGPLEDAFPAGIFALEHRSVTEDPMQNAIELAKALPKGARLSLMSHSRGGLVAELIVRAARFDPETGKKTFDDHYDDRDLAIFEKAGGDTALLQDLSAELKRKNIAVERLIRIAGPIGGTTLASKRLDRALSIALNGLELIPALKASVAYDLLKAFLIGFVKAKNDILPGLEAMMPSSPLVKLVNQADVMSAGTLHVITGDNDGKGVFRRLRNLAVDLFFGSDNDFVVNTPSMLRGLTRLTPPTVTPIVSATITHFGYFRDDATRNAIVSAANSSPGDEIPDNAGNAFVSEAILRPIGVSRARSAGSLPVCFYLPGVMGSHLRHNGKWVWSNPVRMATGGLGRLRMPGTGVTPDEMMDRYYGKLGRYLSRSHDVVLFPYDWREDVLTTGADALAKEVRKSLNESDKPIRFLAHSMGGLVVRAFIDAHPALWAEIKRRKGSRFVMLGTPNGGAFSMVHMMLGRAKAIRQLEALDVTNSLKELLDIVTSMTGPAQLLPADSNGHYLKRSTWDELRRLDSSTWVVPPERVFKASRAAHDLFARQPLDPDLVCYVAGLGADPTPASITIDQSKSGSDRIKFYGTYQGDGTVTWATGIPNGIKPYYVEAIHGDIARTTSAFPAFLDLLKTGKTTGLSTTPPARSRAALDSLENIKDELIEVFPSDDDVLDSFIGAGGPSNDHEAVQTTRTNVTIKHGDLRFTRNSVLVGHYIGDPIDGAEAALDGCLDQSLSQVRDLGLYPGAIETCEVIQREGRNPSGAVVTGLGQFGDLTPGSLSRTVNRAVLRYVLTLRRRAAEAGITPEEMDDINLTSLIIGHKGANMTVQQSIQAILEAVADANLKLDATPIANLEFVELYEDTAFRAADAIHSATLNGPVADKFHFNNRIRTGDGSMLRMDFGLENSEWQRISAARHEKNKDILKFTVISDGAKANFEQTAVETDVIQRLLEQSRKGTATDRDLGRLLFQLMIPLELKAFAQNDQKIQLILDEDTAQFPWELMEDAVSVLGDGLYQNTGEADFRPLVVRTPVLRQLVLPGRVVPRIAGKKVLVVGDPADTGHSPLLGARKEATEVGAKLKDKGGFDVTAFIHTNNAIEILTHVMRSEYKIMHFAAHGIYKANEEGAKSGLVLSNGVHLTSASIHAMEAVPEFVFLNCCHIGRVEKNTGPIAADLSRKLIEKGVRAVVAAGWAVDDAAADLFAEEFYDSMLNGNAFGDAVHHARLAVFERHPETNTWGAYQCYGDPNYRFDERGFNTQSQSQRRTFYSAEHARKAARNIQRNIDSQFRDHADLVAELDMLSETADADWLEDARWCEDMGRAYAKLDVFEPAIAMLEKAKSNHSSSISVNALELLEHLKVRAATYTWSRAEHAIKRASNIDFAAAKQKAKDCKNAQKKVVRAALENLDALDILMGSGTERRELLKGTVSKRKVLTYPKGAPRNKALTEMIGYYKSAMELAAIKMPGRLKPHPTFNWLSGHVVKGSKDIEGQSFEALFSQMLVQNAALENKSPSFSTAALPAEIDVLRGLLAKQEDRQAIYERFEDTFRYAWLRGGNFGQARSIREHVHFLKFMARDDGQIAWMNRVQTFLNDATWTYGEDVKDDF